MPRTPTVQRTVDQPVRAFVEAKTLTVTLDSDKDLVTFEHLARGFGLDIQRTRDLHSKLGSMLVEFDEQREAAAEHDAAITGR